MNIDKIKHEISILSETHKATDDEIDKAISEKIKYVLFNNRNIPINTTKNINKE